MSRTVFINYAILVTIIIVLSSVVVFRNQELEAYKKGDKDLRDSISTLSVQIDSSHARQARLEAQIDILNHTEARVISKTHEKIQFIYSTATPDELDSLIRTNWKTQSRYR